jgi:hypothetical protein
MILMTCSRLLTLMVMERLDTRYRRFCNNYLTKSTQEFQMMINPPKPKERPKPTKALFKSLYQEVKAPMVIENETLPKSDKYGINTEQNMSEDQASMQMNISSKTDETELNQRGGIKSVNFVANI